MKGRIIAASVHGYPGKIFIILRQYQYPGVIFFAEIYDLLADLMCIMFIQVLEMHVIFPVWLTDVVFIGKCPGCFYFFQQRFAMMSVCISTSAVFYSQLPGSFIQNCAYCKAVRIGKTDATYSGAFLHSFLCCPGIGVFLLDRYMEHEPFFLMDQCR